MGKKRPPTANPRLRIEAETNLTRFRRVNPSERPAEGLLQELQVHQGGREMQNEALQQSQNALEELRDRYANLFDSAPVGYLTLGVTGLIEEINLSGAKILGEDRTKILRRRFSRFVISEDRDRWEKHFLHAMRHGRQHTCEVRIQCKDGTSVNANLDCLRIPDCGKASPLRITLTDVSERVRVGVELREGAKFAQGILDAIPSNIAVLNRHGVITAVNKPWLRFAQENSPAQGVQHTYIGTNYLEVCNAADDGMEEGGVKARAGIKAVLDV